MIDTEHGPTLYGHTGNIRDANTLLVNRAELRRLLPWWQRLRICWNNKRRIGRFVLNA